MDKQRLLNLLSKNTYLQHFVTMVYKYEAGKTESGKVNLGSFNESDDIKIGGNSTAFGAGQFTTATRNEVYNKYGVDAWSPIREDQEAAMIALLDMRGVIDEVSVGNFKSLDREGLWETFRVGEPGYKPLNDPAALTDVIAVEENLEAERMDATYAPAESLANLTPEVYAAKMKLYEKQGVFPFDAVQPFLNGDLGSLGDQYIEALDKAHAVGEEKKTQLAVINTPPVETKKPIEKSSVVDTSKLNKSQTTVYNDIVARIDADTDYNEEEKNILKAKSFAEVLDAENINDLRKTQNISLSGLYNQHLSDVKSSKISKLNRLKEDSSLSFEDRDLADKYLTSLKRPTSTSIRDTYGMNIPSYSEEDISNFLSRLDSTVPEPVKTETPTTPTAPTTPTEPVQPQTRGEVPLIKLATKGIESIPNEVDGTPIRQSMSDVPLEPIKNAKLKMAADKISGFLQDSGITGESVTNALRAGAGILSLYEATKKDKVNQAKVSPLMLEAVNRAKEIAKVGMPYEQKMAAIKDLNNAYAGAMKNVMAISGGQRGAALASMGAVDSSRVGALVDLAAKSSDMRMEGMKMFQEAAGNYSKLKLTADMGNEQLRAKLNEGRKERLLKTGSTLYEQAMEFNRNFKDASYNDELVTAIQNLRKSDDDDAARAERLRQETIVNPYLNFDITNTSIPEEGKK